MTSHGYTPQVPVPRLLTRTRMVKRVGALVATAALALTGVIATASPGMAAEPGQIAAEGSPLESITTSPDLTCDVRYAGDIDPEFYGSTACGTLVAVDGTLYGPDYIPAGDAASPRVAYSPVSQSAMTGTGSVASPFAITTKVALGDTGLSLTQVDSYVRGAESYTTTVTLENNTQDVKSAIIYRAADCYLANSDYGTGDVTAGAPACVSDEGRVERWVPVTGAAHYVETYYYDMWSIIGSQQPFPDTCDCDEYIDNAAGLSWNVSANAGSATTVAHLTAFAASEQVADTDGDGLPDDWEINGLDYDGDGVIDVDLPAMGASPDHKDLFVEADWMFKERSCFLWIFCSREEDFSPNLDALADVVEAYANAPVSNPDGVDGIALHIDAGPNSIMNPMTGERWGNRSRANSVGHVADLGEFTSSGAYDWSEFNELQRNNFDTARSDVFHYAIYGDRYGNNGSGSSGIARVGSGDQFKGDSFLITDGGWGSGAGFSHRQESGTFMHEFGHTLGRHHGGDDDANYKPNYVSIMNYHWQLGGIPLDYSREALDTLDEDNLSEAAGLNTSSTVTWICPEGQTTSGSGGTNIDWNCDGSIDSGSVRADLNLDGHFQALNGAEDWSQLIYDGGAVGAFGAGDLTDQDPPLATSEVNEPSYEELLERDALGADGDGSVRIDGASALFADAETTQNVTVLITNVGSAEADYELHFTGMNGVPATVTTTVEGHATETVQVPVTSTALMPGDHSLTVTLTAPGGGDPLDTDTAQITVPDLTDPAVAAEAADALDALQNPVDGLNDELRQQYADALDELLGTPTTPPATPDPTPTANPTATPDPTPTATPDPTPTATPTATPDPTPTANPTATPAPSPTAAPEPTPTTEPTTAPTAAPDPTTAPTDAPDPGTSPEPSGTPDPAGVPDQTPPASPDPSTPSTPAAPPKNGDHIAPTGTSNASGFVTFGGTLVVAGLVIAGLVVMRRRSTPRTSSDSMQE